MLTQPHKLSRLYVKRTERTAGMERDVVLSLVCGAIDSAGTARPTPDVHFHLTSSQRGP